MNRFNNPTQIGLESNRPSCILAYAGWDMAREMKCSDFSTDDIYNSVSEQATLYINEPYLLDNSHCIVEDYGLQCIPEEYELDFINAVGG
jgi:hypothetical protein